MTFDQFTNFVVAHPLLWAGLAVSLAALGVNEWVLAGGAGGNRRPVSASEAVRLMNNHDAIVVDTRSESDYRKNHILNAIHIPAGQIEERAGEISKDKSRAIICYCGTGNQATQAAAKLRKLGYDDVHALRGGISSWESEGLPLTAK